MARNSIPFLLASTASLAWFFSTSNALGQVTVQQPAWRQFQANSSIMVPAGGATYQGGVSRSAFGSRQAGVFPFRPFSNRVTGGEWSTGGVIVTAQIINLREMEAELLTQLTPEYRAAMAQQEAAELHAAAQKQEARQAEIRAGHQQFADQRLEKAKEDVRWARRFAKEGNRAAAEMYYQRAIKSLPADLAEIATEEYNQLRRQ